MAIDPSLLAQVKWDDEPAPAATDKPLEIDIIGGVSESQRRAQAAAAAAQAQPQIDLSQVVWDDAPRASQPAVQPNPTDRMSTTERALAGAGKSLNDTFNGARQLGAMGATSGASSLSDSLRAIGLDGVADAVGRNLLVPAVQYGQRVQADIDEAKRTDAPLMHTGAGLAGNIGGNLLQLLGPGLVARGTAAAPMLLPRTIAGNALQGLAIGAAQPVATGDSRAANALTGAAAGAAGAGLGKAAAATLGAGRNMLASLAGNGLSSVDRAAGQALAREATNPNLLTITQSSVPGVSRTLGEATLDPGLMALENTMRASRRGAFEQIDTANNAARVARLQEIAGTPQQMAAAKAARAAASGGARAEAMGAGPVDVSQTVSQLGDAIKAAEGRPAVQDGLKRLQGLLVRGVDEEGRPVLESRIAVLDNVRQTIGDMLSGKYGGESAAALKGARELIDIRDGLNAEIGSQVPSFAQYLDAYRSASVPINRMQLGARLLRSGSSRPEDAIGNPRLTPAAFSRSAADLDAIAAKATGFKKAKASEIITGQDLASIRAIEDDMRRQFARQSSATVGSQTAERMEVGSRLIRRGAMRAVPGLKDVAEFFEQRASDRLKERMAYLMANPAEAKRVLGALNQGDAEAVRRAIMRLSSSSGVSLATTANTARETATP